MVKESLKEKIKPLWILLSNRWGGSEQVALSDMVELSVTGIPLCLICLEGSPVHAAAIRHAGIKTIPIKQRPSRFDFKFVHILRAVMLDSQATIIHINDESMLGFVVSALFRHPSVSLIVNRHAPLERSPFDLIQAVLFRRVDYMLVLSESVKQTVLSSVGVPEKKIKVINLGLDFSRFDPAHAKGQNLRKQWGADKDTIVVGSVGRMVPSIGQDTFIKAAAGLLKYHDRKIKFVIVAEESVVEADAYVKELQSLIQLFRAQDAITFCSLGDHLPDYMSAFDIFIMPGREEVPGLGALEALAMQRPVVLSNVVGAQEIVGKSEFGLLVRPDDAFDLQQKILNLLDNPSMRLSMGNNGRNHVLKHFDKRIRLLRMLDIYEKCIKRRFSAFP